jgi:hypothetical protein
MDLPTGQEERRDRRFTLREDLAFAEFDDPRDGDTRWFGRLLSLSAAGIAVVLDAQIHLEQGTVLPGVTLQVGECRLTGRIGVKNVRPCEDGTSIIGGLFYPGTEAESATLMTLICGMEAVELDRNAWKMPAAIPAGATCGVDEQPPV